MAKKKDSSQLNWKRKKWYTLVAPATHGEVPIGETMALDSKDIVGRCIEINLMHLTRNMKKQNVNVMFKVTELKEGHGATKSYSYTMQPASIKRLIKAGRDRIDESFIIKSQDGVYARIKPLFITHSHYSAAERTRVRRLSVSFMRKYAAEKPIEELFKEVIDGKVQKELNLKLREVLRLRTCDIRVLEIIENFSALKERKLEKRNERESKRLDHEEREAARRAEEKAEREQLRNEELAEMNKNVVKDEPVQADEIAPVAESEEDLDDSADEEDDSDEKQKA